MWRETKRITLNYSACESLYTLQTHRYLPSYIAYTVPYVSKLPQARAYHYVIIIKTQPSSREAWLGGGAPLSHGLHFYFSLETLHTQPQQSARARTFPDTDPPPVAARTHDPAHRPTRATEAVSRAHR